MPRLIVLTLIESSRTEGHGVITTDPVRIVNQLFTPDGTIVLEYDPITDRTSMVENLLVELGWIGK